MKSFTKQKFHFEIKSFFKLFNFLNQTLNFYPYISPQTYFAYYFETAN